MRASTLLAVAALAGCHGNDPLAHLPPGCAAMLSSCLAVQKICAAGPTCQACPGGQYATANGVCSPIGTPMTHDFAMFTAQGGQEILGLCQSWTLNNATELWVNAVELDQDEASHHSNWLYVPDDKFPGPDGVWPCSDRHYDQLSAALVGGVLYAQSTQATHEVQKFPNNAAVRIAPYSRIISDVHILNASPSAVTGHARLSIYPLPIDQVKIKLTPFHLTFSHLDIPPQATRARGPRARSTRRFRARSITASTPRSITSCRTSTRSGATSSSSAWAARTTACRCSTPPAPRARRAGGRSIRRSISRATTGSSSAATSRTTRRSRCTGASAIKRCASCSGSPTRRSRGSRR